MAPYRRRRNTYRRRYGARFARKKAVGRRMRRRRLPRRRTYRRRRVSNYGTKAGIFRWEVDLIIPQTGIAQNALTWDARVLAQRLAGTGFVSMYDQYKPMWVKASYSVGNLKDVTGNDLRDTSSVRNKPVKLYTYYDPDMNNRNMSITELLKCPGTKIRWLKGYQTKSVTLKPRFGFLTGLAAAQSSGVIPSKYIGYGRVNPWRDIADLNDSVAANFQSINGVHCNFDASGGEVIRCRFTMKVLFRGQRYGSTYS